MSHSFLKKAGWVVVLLPLFLSIQASACGNWWGVKAGFVGNQHFFVLPEYKLLHTTHQDNFTGGEVTVIYRVSRSLFLGLGTGYSHDNYHGDNGWRLYNLRFIPVFADARLFLPGIITFAPFLQLSEGISFNHYKRMDRPYTSSYYVSETGDYLYTGIGCIVNISRHLKPEISVGFDGYKMSFDSWDVNPHGITFSMGLIF